MQRAKMIKNMGLAMMVLGLIYMFVAYILTDQINHVSIGLVIVSIGGFVNYYGDKQLPKNKS